MCLEWILFKHEREIEVRTQRCADGGNTVLAGDGREAGARLDLKAVQLRCQLSPTPLVGGNDRTHIEILLCLSLDGDVPRCVQEAA